MRIIKNILIGLVCGSVLLAATPGHALIKAVDLDVTGSLSTSYDDNILESHENERDDFITNVVVGLGLRKSGKTHDLDVSADFTQQLFFDHTDFNNNAQNVRVSFLKEFSKYDRGSFRNTFRHAEEPDNFEDAFGRTAGRYRFFLNRMNLDYAKDLSKQTALSVSYGNEVYEVSREDLSDSFLQQASVEFSYFKSSATVVTLAYYFATREFDPGADSTVHSLATGVRHYLTKQLYFDASTGVSLVEDFSGKSTTEPRVFVTLTDDIDENTSASLSFSKQSFPNGFTEDVFDSWRLTARLRHQLRERIGVSLSAFYGDGDFNSLNIQDQLLGVNSRLSYDINEDVKAYLAYAYSQTESNIATREYQKNVITVGVNVSF